MLQTLGEPGKYSTRQLMRKVMYVQDLEITYCMTYGKNTKTQSLT